MSQTERELRRRIIEAPDDDTLRLVYADWLEERGELDRAELIRLQIAQARIDRGDPRWLDHEAACRALAAGLESEVAQRWVIPAQRLWFERGMVAGVRTSLANFLAWGAGLVSEHPITELELAVHVTAPIEAAERLAAMPELSRIERLSLGDLAPDGVRAVLESPHLTGLRALELHHRYAANRPPAPELLPDLERLSMFEISADHALELAASGRLAPLRALGIERSHLTAEALAAIAAAVGPDLECLSLRYDDLDELDGDWPDLGALRCLRLDGNDLRGAAPGLLERLDRSRLVRLGLGANELFSDHLAPLAAAGFFDELRELVLAENPLDDRFLVTLSRTGAQLHALDLASTRIGDRALATLLDSPVCDQLRYLDISFTDCQSPDSDLSAVRWLITDGEPVVDLWSDGC